MVVAGRSPGGYLALDAARSHPRRQQRAAGQPATRGGDRVGARNDGARSAQRTRSAIEIGQGRGELLEDRLIVRVEGVRSRVLDVQRADHSSVEHYGNDELRSCRLLVRQVAAIVCDIVGQDGGAGADRGACEAAVDREVGVGGCGRSIPGEVFDQNSSL